MTRMPPQVAMQYDVGKIFAWMAQLGGLKNINQMKLQAQVVPDAQLQQQAGAGNVIPLRAGAGVGSPDVTTQMGQNAMDPNAAGGY
jgi:hypothetical protein